MMKLYKLYLLLILAVSGCVDLPDEFHLPAWDVDLNIPIKTETYTLDEIIESTSYITIDSTLNSDSLYILQSDVYCIDQSVEKFLRINKKSSINNIPVVTTDDTGFTIYAPLPDSLLLEEGEFESGLIFYKFINNSDARIILELEFPAFKDKSGENLLVRIVTDAGETDTLTRSLAGYHYTRPLNQPDSLSDAVQVIINPTSPKGTGKTGTLDLQLYDLHFVYIQGNLPPTTLGLRNKSFAVFVGDATEFRDNLYLREAELNISLLLKTDMQDHFDAEVRDLNIIAKRNSGEELLLVDNQGNSSFYLKLKNGLTNKTFNEENSNANDFVAFLPDSILLRGEFVVNPDYEPGSISILDSVIAEVEFSSVSHLALTRTSLSDTSVVNLSEDERTSIRNGRFVKIEIEAENAVPITTWLTLSFLDENKLQLFKVKNETTQTDTFYFPGAETNPVGDVISAVQAPPAIIELDSAQIEMFSKAYYVVAEIAVQTKEAFNNPPQIVTVRPSDWVSVRAKAMVEYHLTPD